MKSLFIVVRAQLYFYQLNQEGRGVGWEGCLGVGGTWRMRVTLSANENERVKKLSWLSFTLTAQSSIKQCSRYYLSGTDDQNNLNVTVSILILQFC